MTSYLNDVIIDSLLAGRPPFVPLGRRDAPHSWTYVPDVGRLAARIAAGDAGGTADIGDTAWGRAWHVPTSTTIWPLLGVAFMGTLGQIFMTRAFGQGKTLVSAVLSYSGIVFSSLFGIWIFGDDLPWSSWLAIAMIIFAGVIALRTTSRSRTAKR